MISLSCILSFFFQAEDGIRVFHVTGVQTLLFRSSLGFEADALTAYREALARPNGIILVTGPTGSGKTTTLYTSLIELNTPDRKLLTVEDPIERSEERRVGKECSPRRAADEENESR